jgi:hypothetical protein
MPWDGVPWFVEQPARHSASIARKLAYASVGGQQGIIAPTDCEVRELAVPGTQVRVFPGLVSILNKATGVTKEAYLGSLATEDVVDIVATTASGPRSDMVCARVENPSETGGGWSAPADPQAGPYIKTVVISNVGSSAVVPPGTAGKALIPLARIDIPASTGTILQSYIKDLRKMAAVLRDSQRIMLPCPGQHTLPTSQNTYITWPSPPMTGPTIDIPEWATKCFISGTVSVVNIPSGGNARGDLRAGLGTLRTAATMYDYDTTGTTGVDRQNLLFGGPLDIPASMRGTTQPLVSEGRGYTVASGNTIPIYAELYSTVSVQVDFQAKPASNL